MRCPRPTSVALRRPVVDGVNVMDIVQAANGASDAPQVFVCEKSPGFVPLRLMLLIIRAALPTLVIVTV